MPRGSKAQHHRCVEQYGELFERLQDAMLRLQPRPLLMFRSSTSAWQKWGNWGFTWSPQKRQPYTSSSAMVARMNRKATTLLNPAVTILDGFHLTAPRPDHTEISNEQSIGGHLVHHGTQVAGVLNWLFTHALLAKTDEGAYMNCSGGRPPASLPPHSQRAPPRRHPRRRRRRTETQRDSRYWTSWDDVQKLGDRKDLHRGVG